MSKVQEVLKRNNITLEDAKNMCGIVNDLLNAYLEEMRGQRSDFNSLVDCYRGAEVMINKFTTKYEEEKYFLVDIVEHYSKRVKVKAKDFDEACSKADKAWREGKIVMNGDDYADGEVVGGMVASRFDFNFNTYEEVEE